MSAYGAITSSVKPVKDLPVLSYTLPNDLSLVTFAVHGSDTSSELISYFFEVFNQELADGKTYPQEGPMSRDEFVNYFFASTTIIGILVPSNSDIASLDTIDKARAGRSWEECAGGCYYVKPNYPGRSSHNCNAGFLVPPIQRGKKIGGALAESFLIYAPRLGYKSSVFNLVFKNNAASLRMWDKLGFTRAGLIPNAGRLKTGPNGEEEYVDAVVVYKCFE